MDIVEHGLVSLLWLVGGAFLIALFSGRVLIPGAVLLMGYGVIVGPVGFGLVSDGELVSFVYELGFIVLMFLAGLEIDFNKIRKRGMHSLGIVLLLCLGIFAVAFVAAWLLALTPIYGLALGATSVGMPLAVLKESHQQKGAGGQMIILVGSVGEFLTIVGMTLFYFIETCGFSLELLLGLGRLALILFAAVVTLRLFVAYAWWRPHLVSTLGERHHGSEIGVRASLFAMLLFSVLAIHAGVEAILGSFLAGAIIAFGLRGKDVLEEKLAAVGHGLFIPLFFIIIGLRFDASRLDANSLFLAIVLLVVIFLARFIPSLAMLRLGLSFRDMSSSAALLSAPLTLIVAIGVLGMELSVLDAEGLSTLIILAMASGTVFPVLYRLICPKPRMAIESEEHR
ncbi:MAG: cation:proton antiporter [Myxococcota bacterium]|jgi:Kef-type K+ transport system membrane component KefB|nr:cation:proton antiporter [Myxococcota bacterium]